MSRASNWSTTYSLSSFTSGDRAAFVQLVDTARANAECVTPLLVRSALSLKRTGPLRSWHAASIDRLSAKLTKGPAEHEADAVLPDGCGVDRVADVKDSKAVAAAAVSDEKLRVRPRGRPKRRRSVSAAVSADVGDRDRIARFRELGYYSHDSDDSDPDYNSVADYERPVERAAARPKRAAVIAAALFPLKMVAPGDTEIGDRDPDDYDAMLSDGD
jgi:hypothetical protein